MEEINNKKQWQSAEDKALEKFAELMVKRIKEISEDWKKPWFTENMVSWPMNLSGRFYNGSNALLLQLVCLEYGYNIPVFCTFNQICNLNFNAERKRLTDEQGEPLPSVSVGKGEKSCPVFFTTFTVIERKTGEKIPYDDYKQLPVDEKEAYVVFPSTRLYNVFNINQTNIREVRPELYQKLLEKTAPQKPDNLNGEDFKFPAMDEIIAKDLWECPIKLQHQDKAYYSPLRDEIVLPEQSQFVDGESFYSTAWHEMTHSTGHESRLNRFATGPTSKMDYAREELVAELSAALIGSRFGIQKNIKSDSAAYLKWWLQRLEESPEFLRTTLRDVKKATAMICDCIDRVQSTQE
jgi:antirestriction protein ArdC